MLSYLLPLLAGLAAVGAGWSRPLAPVPDGVLRPLWDAAAAALLTLLVLLGSAVLPGGVVPSPLHTFALFWLGVAALADARCGLLPERWTRFGIGVLFVLLVLETADLGAEGPGIAALRETFDVTLRHLAWGVVLPAVLYALRAGGYLFARAPGVGLGDIKLACGLGLAFGGYGLVITYGAFALTGVYVLARRLIAPSHPPRAALPLGPGFFLAASLVALVPVGPILDVWLFGGGM